MQRRRYITFLERGTMLGGLEAAPEALRCEPSNPNSDSRNGLLLLVALNPERTLRRPTGACWCSRKRERDPEKASTPLHRRHHLLLISLDHSRRSRRVVVLHDPRMPSRNVQRKVQEESMMYMRNGVQSRPRGVVHCTVGTALYFPSVPKKRYSVACLE